MKHRAGLFKIRCEDEGFIRMRMGVMIVPLMCHRGAHSKLIYGRVSLVHFGEYLARLFETDSSSCTSIELEKILWKLGVIFGVQNIQIADIQRRKYQSASPESANNSRLHVNPVPLAFTPICSLH